LRGRRALLKMMKDPRGLSASLPGGLTETAPQEAPQKVSEKAPKGEGGRYL